MSAPKPLRPSAATAPSRSKFLLPIVLIVSLGTFAAANYFTSATLHPSTNTEAAAPPTATAPSQSPMPPAMRQTPLPDQDYVKNPQGAAKRIQRLVRETGGDWSKLSPDDQRLFQSVSSGHGPEMLRSQAQQIKKEAARGKVTPPPGSIRR